MRSANAGKRTLDDGVIDAVPYAHPTLHAEAVARDNQQFVLFCLLGESLRIGFKRTHPQVKRSLRRDAFVAEFGKAVIEQIPILAIGIDITWLVDAAFYDGLEKNRRAYESKKRGPLRIRPRKRAWNPPSSGVPSTVANALSRKA